MKIKKLNESSLVDKKMNTLGKDEKPMYFTANQLKDAKAKYPEYDFEETTIDKSLPQGQKAYIAKRKVTEDIDDSGELEANKMTIMPLAGLNADGFTVVINDAAGRELFKKEYSYGYNASYDRKFARWAEEDYNNSIKYGWKTPRALKPYVADIIDELCSKYGIDKNSIEFAPGKNIFTGGNVKSDFVDKMKKLVYEAKQIKAFGAKAKKLNENVAGIEVATIADYIVDHYDFDDIDDKYSCINSIRDSFKGQKTISKEELEQFIGAHNGRDKVEEALTEDKGQPRSNRYRTYFNRIKRAIEKGDEETLKRTKEAIMYAPAKELKNSEADELMDMIKNRKINEASYGGAFDIADDQYFTREDLNESTTNDVGVIEDGTKVGMASVVSDLIKDEYEAIDGYNSAIATAKAEGFEEAVNILAEIQAEENIHVGQLQEVMKLFDPNADKVEEGQVEGAEQLANPIGDDDLSDDQLTIALEALDKVQKNSNNLNNIPNNINEDDIEEEIVPMTEAWEDVYQSFKDIEKQLNGDGEAITATIDRIYQDNKGNPDFEKAYQKWASNE